MRVPVLAFLVGCAASDGVGVPPATWDGPLLVDEVLIDCDGVSEWLYEVRTLGFGGDVTVDVVGRAYGAIVWREHGELAEVEKSDTSALYRLSLDQVTTGAEEGTSTAIPCEAKTLVTYGFATWRGGDLDECIAWGIDPTGEFPECANWGTTGHGAI